MKNIVTPAGKFVHCLKTEETTPLKTKGKGYKLYAPEIGFIKDGSLLLTEYGYQYKFIYKGELL